MNVLNYGHKFICMDLVFLFMEFFYEAFLTNMYSSVSVSKNTGIDTNITPVILVQSDFLVTCPKSVKSWFLD